MLIAVAVGLAVMWTARLASAPSGSPVEPPTGSALRRDTGEAQLILAARMARGEIDTQEYQARLDALRTGSPQ